MTSRIGRVPRILVATLPLVLLVAGCATTRSSDVSGLDAIAARDGFVPFPDVLRENQASSTECTDYDPASRTCTLITTYVLAGSSGSSAAEFQVDDDPFVGAIGTLPFTVNNGFPCANFANADLEVISDDAAEADVVADVGAEVMAMFASIGEVCAAYFRTDVPAQYRVETYTPAGDEVLGSPPELVTYTTDDVELRLE
ncbi:MAG: hypothetical protein AAFX10_11195 [Pseudomonadota bacterium]